MKKSLLLALLVSAQAHAWSDHSLGTYVALEGVAGVDGAPAVTVESFEAFLQKEKAGLVALSDSEEAWARAHVPNYAARPAALSFNADAPNAREAFLRSLRLNPTIKLALFLQRIPGTPTATLPTMPYTDVTISDEKPGSADEPFAPLAEGQAASVRDVVATAADEPDYGFDLGLWEDNHTSFGKDYGLGKQPFGNPAYTFSSQAPFHMGYYHESGIVYKAAPFLKRTYPEVRVHQFLSLARYAFAHGHAYWGWRFIGMGSHYVQDLTQPFHSTVLPGVSVAKMLTVNIIDMIGIHGPKTHKIDLVSNRHFAIENFEYSVLSHDIAQGRMSTSPVLVAMKSADFEAKLPPYSDAYCRDVVSLRSNKLSKLADKTLKSSLPKRLVNDPSYHFGVDQPVPDTREIVAEGSAKASDAMYQLLTTFMREFGAHTRKYVGAATR